MRSIILMMTCALALAVACSGDEAKDAADSTTSAAKDMMQRAESAAKDVAARAEDSATDAANKAIETAQNTAGTLAGAAKDATAGADPAAACRSLAESGAWGQALDVCKKAHEMMPDDLALEHAYQQAKAAAAQ